MMGRSFAQALLVAAVVAVGGCSAKGNEKAAPTSPPLGAQAKPPVAVEVVPARTQDLEQGVEVVGALAPKFEAVVKSELPGLLTEVAVTQWVRVKKGQVLARIDTREMESTLARARASVESAKASEESAKAGLLEAKVAADRADREWERLKRLKEAGLATQQSLDDQRSAREAAQARIAAAQGQIGAAAAQVTAAREEVRQIETRLTKAVVRSPMDGIVSERDVNVGDLPGDKPMFRIVDNSLLNLTVTVPSRDMASVRVGQPVTFATDALPGETFTGRVMFVNPSVDPADRSVKVVAEVRNVPERLKGGLFVKGRIVTGQREGVLQVPRQALLTWDVVAGRGDLFVVQGAAARKKSVQTGAASGDRVEVTAGLVASEPVIVRGAFNLKDGDPVRVEATGPQDAAAGGK
ncbi:MAG: efflux RND transporter periplasmic adaptor subunit [Deltaproteobacteria bacterium]|nr:efflux RND transporter periplasmic adaptor subunit [Deltaproteobacteria bacterium]